MAIKALGLISPPRGPKSQEEVVEWCQGFTKYMNEFLYSLEETIDAVIAGSIGTTELTDSGVTAVKIASGAFSTVTGTANVAIDSAAVVTFTISAAHAPLVISRCTALLWTVHVATTTTSQVEVIVANRTLSTAGVTVYVDYFPAA